MMQKNSDKISDSEKLLQTFKYSLMLENTCKSKLVQNDNLKNELNKFKINNTKKDVIIYFKDNEINSLTAELENYGNKFDKLNVELVNYKLELNNLRYDNIEKEELISVKNNEISDLMVNLNKYKNQCNILNKKSEEFKKDNEEKDKLINELNYKNSCLEKEISDLNNKFLKNRIKNLIR